MPDPTKLLALVDSFDWEKWSAGLREGLTQQARDLVVVSGTAIAQQHGVAFDQHDPMLDEHFTEYVADRITQLNDTTRDQVKAAIRSAFTNNQDLSPAELQDVVLEVVRGKFAEYEAYRALRIARTESAIAYNAGAVLGAAAADFTHVDVYDGTDDPECAEANGSVWTIKQALANPLAHPNCRRSFSPHIDEQPAQKVAAPRRALSRVERALAKRGILDRLR